MKTSLLQNLLVFSIILNITLYIGYAELEKELSTIKADTTVKFIWNDDEESIPTDSSLISLEMIKGDTIYIGPYDKLYKTE